MKAITQIVCLLAACVLVSSCYQPRPLPTEPPIGNRYVDRLDYDGNRRTNTDLGPLVDKELTTPNAAKYVHNTPYVNRMDFDGDKRSHAHDAPLVNQPDGEGYKKPRRAQPIMVQPRRYPGYRLPSERRSYYGYPMGN